MKILLVATNQADRYMDRMVVRPLPIGLAYLAAYLDKDRHEVSVLDLMFSDSAIEDVAERVELFQPDVVGLSIRNLDNQSFVNPVWHLPRVQEIASKVRSICDATIVCGGPAFSVLPAECLRYLEADIGIAGDAAQSFSDLIDRLAAEAPYTDIPGAVYWENDRVVVTESRFTSEFSIPPQWDMLDMERYRKSGFGIGVVTKLARGYYPSSSSDSRFTGDDWRIRPNDEVIQEIEDMHDRFRIRNVFFIDSGFNIPLDHAKQLCRSLIDNTVPIRWNSYVRPGEFDEELVDLMKQSGCSLALTTGVDSAADIGGTDDGSMGTREIAELCRRAKLPFAVSVTFGDAGETEESVARKFDFLRATAPDFATLRIGNRVLPGTDVAKLAREDGLIGSESELIQPVFYVEHGVRDWIEDRVRTESADQPRWNII